MGHDAQETHRDQEVCKLVSSYLPINAEGKWEGIVVRAKVGIGFHGIVSLNPTTLQLPTLSVVGQGEVTISIKH